MTGPSTARGFWNTVATDPDHVAIIDPNGVPTTYGELAANINRVSHGLHALGLRVDDAIAAALPNCTEFLECYFAAHQSGLYFVPINRHLAAPEVAYIVSDSEARAFVTHSHLGSIATDAARGATCPPDARFVVGELLPGFRPYSDLLASQPDTRPTERPAGQMMMYSSGTTGRPKGVRRPRPAGDPDELAVTIAEVTCKGFGIQRGSVDKPGVHLVCGPMYHAGPILGAVNTLQMDHTLVLMDSWDAERTLELIDTYRVTSTQMVPTMFHRLLALPKEVRDRYDVSTLESVLHTGAPCPVEIKAQMMDWFGPVLYETYGGTEVAAAIAKPHRWLERPGTVGKAIHGVTITILDDDDHECPPGTPGLVYISTGNLGAPEYFKDPEKTKAMQRGNSVTLGDIGYLDDDGWLFLCDRKVDMIISGGVNVYPAEVEAALLAHPAVGDAAVIGIPNPEWGEEVKAVVEPAAGIEPSPELATELIDFCRERIARFKCPRTVDFRELPRLPNGKLLKRRLREDYLADNLSDTQSS